MTAEVLKRAFEPFFTTRKSARGTGPRPQHVYGFIRQSNGFVEIRSEAGRGTAISLYLPRSDPAAVAAVPEHRRVLAKGSERILVVEDEDSVRAIVGEQLASLGYRVTLAGNADEALERLRAGRFDPCPDRAL